jgi:alkylated DNA repair dioxygenase AlkB
MNEIVVLRKIVPEDLIDIEEFSELPFSYDGEEFKEHMRYPNERTKLPNFLLRLSFWIYEKFFKDYSDLDRDSVLINKYEGDEGCSWHRDYNDESYSMKKNCKAVRLALTIGPDKIFSLRDIETKEIASINLSHGDCVIMSENFDEFFEHSVPACNDGQKRYTFMITFEVNEHKIRELFQGLGKLGELDLEKRKLEWENHVLRYDGDVELCYVESKCEKCKPCLDRYKSWSKELENGDISNLHEKCIHGDKFLGYECWKTHGHDYSCIHAKEIFERDWKLYTMGFRFK